MSCPYLHTSSKPRCGVFDGKYQPSPCELERFCRKSDFVSCKIYNFYVTTFCKTSESDYQPNEIRGSVQ